METIPKCDNDCINIDPPYCHCLACVETGVALNKYGECSKCAFCQKCPSNKEPNLLADFNDNECLECKANPVCPKCHIDRMNVGDEECESCKISPPADCPEDCSVMDKAPYCHCLICGVRKAEDPKHYACSACKKKGLIE